MMHVACIGIFFVDFHWWAPLLALGSHVFRNWCLTAGFHRYFAHRSYKTSRWFQFVLAFIGGAAVQKGALWWAANHRHHHRYSDTEDDLHSPHVSGFWWSHFGWILSSQWSKSDHEAIRDFSKYPELRFLDRHYWFPAIVWAVAMYLLGGWTAFFWGFVLSTVTLYHVTFCVNSLNHLIGTRRYKTTDQSRNHWFLALITMGEGWHNNHHHYQSSANQGFFWWEVDFSYMGLRALNWLGIVWDMRLPPKEHLYAHLEGKGEEAITPATPSTSGGFFPTPAVLANALETTLLHPPVPATTEGSLSPPV